MAKQYNPRHFFRNVSNSLLAEYFVSKQVLTGFDFEKLSEARIDPLYEEWNELPDSQRLQMEKDFQAIHSMSREGATKAFIDEARYHEEDISEALSQLNNHHDRAFWVFHKHPDFWQGATRFLHVDTIGPSFWIRRSDIPKKKPKLENPQVTEMEQAIGRFFHERQGRGQNCHIEHYRRNDLLYLFAYPEDYTQASVEWINHQFERPSRTPAFEVIFVYSQAEGTLDIMPRRDKKVVEELQTRFVEIILGDELKIFGKVKKVYELNKLKSRNFQFVLPLSGSIEDVRVKSLRFSNKFGDQDRIILEAPPENNRDAVYRLVDQTFHSTNPIEDYHVTQASLKVKYTETPESEKTKHKTIKITYPDSCSLKHEGLDQEIRQMLFESGLEVRNPQQPLQESPVPPENLEAMAA